MRHKIFNLVVLALLLGTAAVVALQRHRIRVITEQSRIDEVSVNSALAKPKPGFRIEFDEPQVWHPAMAEARKKKRCTHISYDEKPKSYARLADPAEDKYVQMNFREEPSIRAVERLLVRGDAYYDRGQSKRAIVDFQQALEYDPNDYRLYLHLSYAHSELKDYSSALECVSKALELEPGLLTAYGDRSWYLHKLGQTAAVDEDWAVYLSVNPREAWEYSNLASELYNREQYAEAEAAADESLRLSSGRKGMGVKGKLLLKRGEPAEALEYFERGAEKHFHSAFYHNRRAEALDALGRNQEAAAARAEVARLKSEVLN